MLTALTQPNPEGLEAEIARCRALTDRPFGVDVTVGVVANEINYDDYVDVIIDSSVKIVETGGRSPEPFMERFKAALAPGCEGINTGTRFLVTKEAPILEGIKQQVVEMDENRTRLLFAATGIRLACIATVSRTRW